MDERKQILENDRPIANASIRAIRGGRIHARATSDENGRFTFRLPEGYQAEKYDVNRSEDDVPKGTASVVQESPLVIQVSGS